MSRRLLLSGVGPSTAQEAAPTSIGLGISGGKAALEDYLGDMYASKCRGRDAQPEPSRATETLAQKVCCLRPGPIHFLRPSGAAGNRSSKSCIPLAERPKRGCGSARTVERCPPNIISSSCCDCELERCWERLDHPAKGLWPELRRLWWPRAMPFTGADGANAEGFGARRPALASSDQSEERWRPRAVYVRVRCHR